MAEKLILKISPAVAAFVRSGLSSTEKLLSIEAAPSMTCADHLTLLFCLMRDADQSVKEAGSSAFAALPETLLMSCVAVPGIHPAILDAIARFHHGNAAVVSTLLEYPTLSREARVFLEKKSVITVSAPSSEDEALLGYQDAEPVTVPDSPEGQPGEEPEKIDLDTERLGNDAEYAETEPDKEVEAVEENEEHFSKYRLIQLMGIGEKIKMAMTGDKEWRSILINDTNKLVSSSVIKNPRITDGEILRILKVGVQNDEIVRLICDNREWVKNSLIRKALVDCPKTPLPNALRYLASLGDKEIAAYAKSKNVSSVLSTQAKRIMLAKKR